MPPAACSAAPMPASNQPERLGTVLQGLIDQLGMRRKIDAVRIIETWAAVAGPQINAVTDSAWVKNEKLFVRISSSAWRHELHLGRQAWRARLNGQLGGDLVREIVFR
jgi:predicted nucleic acid-binding Zn ribbon protein